MIALHGVSDGARLSDIDLIVKDGELTVLLGPAGAGKTALLRIMAGLDQPRQGTIESAAGSSVAMIYPGAVNYPTMSVHDNIAAPLRRRRLAAAEIDRKVRASARLMDLGPHLDSRANTLSAELQQRTAIARALVREPDVLLLDDPLANLGTSHGEGLRGELRAILAEYGGVAVYATSDPRDAMVFGGRTVILDGGRVAQSGRFGAIYHAPATLRVGEITGDPPINIIDGHIDGGTAVLGAGTRVALPDHLAVLAAGPYRFAIRAHHLTLIGRASDNAALAATVEFVENDGVDTAVYFRHGDGVLMAQVGGIHALEIGGTATIFFDPIHLLAFHEDGVLAASSGSF